MLHTYRWTARWIAGVTTNRTSAPAAAGGETDSPPLSISAAICNTAQRNIKLSNSTIQYTHQLTRRYRYIRYYEGGSGQRDRCSADFTEPLRRKDFVRDVSIQKIARGCSHARFFRRKTLKSLASLRTSLFLTPSLCCAARPVRVCWL